MPRANRIAIVLTQEQREAFWSRVALRPDTTKEHCWIWCGRVDDFGYGHFKVKGRSLKAHRVAWTIINGPVPDDKTLDHTCRNPRCVNPAHMEPVTNRENILRGISPTAINALKTHCPRGHHLEGANLLPNKHGRRSCRICAKALRLARTA